MATFTARLPAPGEAVFHHNEHVYEHVEEASGYIVETKITSRFRIRHKVAEAEQKVSQYEYCALIERFNVVHEV